ncbi:2-hydroxyacid dehydrogenase [Noviherbaspirillum sp. ST9]|uniref:2-hydroxyacid dehydrogenase n=1 Tax=Noviherbaspirillum sp. ST9 TaxID=3401606 RepID=UPI003B588861
MKKTILQNGRLLPALESMLAEEFDVHGLWAEPEPQAFLARHGARFSGLVTSAPVGASAELMAALPNLEVISSFGVGFDKLDLEAAKERGVRVAYTPDVLNDCVADLAFGLLIDVARGISAADRFVRRGEWAKGRYPVTSRVSGKRLGIVGLGRIGQTIAKRAAGFDMEVAYTNRGPAQVPYRYEPSLAALAEWADFLVVAVAGGNGTKGLISRDILQALGPKGFLVNVSRGTVVDERALVEALVAGSIAGAGVDVFENEPHVPAELLGLDNVVVLPHVASGTEETRRAMGDLVLANLRAYFATRELVTPLI